MADAAKSARTAFGEIKDGAGSMGSAVSGSLGKSRQGVMLLGEEFGIHLPRGITAFVSSLGPVGAAMEAAFPFIAIAVGATLLIEHLVKLKAEGQKLTEDQVKFGTAVQNAFNSLDQKLIQAAIKTDELRNNHLGALHHQLELIDMQSMAELVHSFEEVAKSADVVFADLKSNWYQFGSGSTGAKHALDEFQTKYDALLAAGKDGEASDLLKGTKESAEKVLALQQKAASTTGHASGSGDDNRAALLAHEATLNQLKQSGAGFTEKEIQAQQTLVGALQAQVGLEQKIATLKAADKSNATRSTGNEMAGQAAAGAKEAAEHRQRMGEMEVAAEREQANTLLSLKQASVIERLASDIHLEAEEYRIKQEGNAALLAALDKAGKDYQNQYKALQDKEQELTLQHENTVAALGAKARQDAYRQALQEMEASEREKLNATDQGSRARLAALDAAIKDEESKNLQGTEHYRELLAQRVEETRRASEEEAKLTAEAARQESENILKTGELSLTAERAQTALRDSARRVSVQQQLDEETEAADKEYDLKLGALARETAALIAGEKDHQNKLKALQNQEAQLTQQHEAQITDLKTKAEEERNAKIKAAENKYLDSIASGLTQVLMGHKSFASMMSSIGNEVVSDMMQFAIKHIETNMMTKQSDASLAARTMFNAGTKFPFPANVVMAPLLGAAAYAEVMAFSGGGVVPGVGTGDVVPAMLTPGEGVVPRGTMDMLGKMARDGNSGGDTHYHAPIHYAPQIQAIDANGVKTMLDSHAKVFQGHVESTLRKMNR